MRQPFSKLFEEQEFNPGRFLERLEGVIQYVRRGATEGERNAAKEALNRMMERAKSEIAQMRNTSIDHYRIESFERSLQAAINGLKNPQKEQPKVKPETRPATRLFKVDQWVVQSSKNRVGKITEIFWDRLVQSYFYKINFPSETYDGGGVIERALRRATQEEVDAALAKKPKKPEPKFKVGDWVSDGDMVGKILKINDYHYNSYFKRSSYSYVVEYAPNFTPNAMEDILRPATQEEIDAELAARTKSKSTENITIVAMARYIDMEMKSNKVYGIIETDDKKVFVFWGGYHKALKVKKYRNISDAFNQFWTKTNKGYVEQSPEQIRRNTDWVIEALDAEFAKN